MRNMKLAIAITITALTLSGCQGFSGNKNPESYVLELSEISPLAPKAVTEETILEAHIKYQIKDFQKGKYFIIAQFETCNPEITYDGDMPKSEYAYPTSSNGSVVFKFPMKYVWNQKIVTRPYVVRFYLNKGNPEEITDVVAETGPVIYATESEK